MAHQGEFGQSHAHRVHNWTLELLILQCKRDTGVGEAGNGDNERGVGEGKDCITPFTQVT